jgi:hypothetical protein
MVVAYLKFEDLSRAYNRHLKNMFWRVAKAKLHITFLLRSRRKKDVS